MAKIALEGMVFYAYHGFYPEEQLIGSEYIVSIYIDTNFTKAATSDDLEGTINYETIYRVVKVEMQKKTKLLEAVLQRIIVRIRSLFDSIEAITVRLCKKNPPLGAQTEQAWVELSENYVMKCAKCTKNFLMQTPGDNWTKYGQIYPETRATLTRTFGALLCKSCLEPYFIKPKTPTEQ